MTIYHSQRASLIGTGQARPRISAPLLAGPARGCCQEKITISQFIHSSLRTGPRLEPTHTTTLTHSCTPEVRRTPAH